MRIIVRPRGQRGQRVRWALAFAVGAAVATIVGLALGSRDAQPLRSEPRAP